MTTRCMTRMMALLAVVLVAAFASGCEATVGVGIGVGYPYGPYGGYPGYGPWGPVLRLLADPCRRRLGRGETGRLTDGIVAARQGVLPQNSTA